MPPRNTLHFISLFYRALDKERGYDIFLRHAARFSARLHPGAIDTPCHRSRRFQENFMDAKRIRNPG